MSDNNMIISSVNAVSHVYSLCPWGLTGATGCCDSNLYSIAELEISSHRLS